ADVNDLVVVAVEAVEVDHVARRGLPRDLAARQVLLERAGEVAGQRVEGVVDSGGKEAGLWAEGHRDVALLVVVLPGAEGVEGVLVYRSPDRDAGLPAREVGLGEGRRPWLAAAVDELGTVVGGNEVLVLVLAEAVAVEVVAARSGHGRDQRARGLLV